MRVTLTSNYIHGNIRVVVKMLAKLITLLRNSPCPVKDKDKPALPKNNSKRHLSMIFFNTT